MNSRKNEQYSILRSGYCPHCDNMPINHYAILNKPTGDLQVPDYYKGFKRGLYCTRCNKLIDYLEAKIDIFTLLIDEIDDRELRNDAFKRYFDL